MVTMNYLEDTKKILHKLKPFLENYCNVAAIGLFGSIVRDDFKHDTSDIDIAVSFTQPVGIEFVDLAYLLEKELKRKVDLVSINGIKEKYLKKIEKDIVYV